MSKVILEKANLKLKELIEAPVLNLPKTLGMISTLKVCYPEEFKKITQEVQLLINEQKELNQDLLSGLTSLSISADFFEINQQQIPVLKINEITSLFNGYPYEFINTAYCLIPENLLLLSLRGINEVN